MVTVVNTGSTSQCMQTYCVPCHSIAMCIGQTLVTIQLLASWKSSHEVLLRNSFCPFVSRSTLWIPEHQNGAMVSKHSMNTQIHSGWFSVSWSPWWGHDANFAPTHPMECVHTVVPVVWFYCGTGMCLKIHANILTAWLIQHVQANLK